MSSERGVPTFILQSDDLLREGLRLILSKTPFRPQACAIELDDLAKVPTDRPVVFIVGVGRKQTTICSTIRAQYPLALIVAVANEDNPSWLTNALDDGANAALFSSVTPEALVNALRVVASGQLVIDARLWPSELQPEAEIQPKIAEQASPPIQNAMPWETEIEDRDVRQLSAREIAILERIVRGDSNKHVARYFKIAEPTVKAHIRTIFRKIGAINRTQAATWALNHRLFEEPSGTAPAPSELMEHRASSDSQISNSTPSALRSAIHSGTG